MKTQELREKTVSELTTELKDVLKQQFNLRMQNVMGETPRIHYFKEVRRSIARIKTIIAEKERNND